MSENQNTQNPDQTTKKVYLKTNEEVALDLETDQQTGLSVQEANLRLEKNGPNKLNEIKKKSFLMKLAAQFKEFMIIILLIAAILAIVMAYLPSGDGNPTDGILIISIVVINALLSVFQEHKAEKSTEAIKALSSPHVTVIRDGVESVIDVKDIVVGDLVVLTAGDYVPADVRIIESVNLRIDESILTGEAVPVEKVSNPLIGVEIPLGDRFNMAYMSTVVTYGRGKALVVKTAMDTQIGKIAAMLSESKDESTPLQKNISKLGKILAVIALIIVSSIFLLEIMIHLIGNNPMSEFNWMYNILFAVSLAVAAIPEGLPAIVTVVLSLGMSNLAKHKAIMRTLPAVETLGSTQIICSDKTGTLTQNVMTIQQVFINNEVIQINSDTVLNQDLEFAAGLGVLVNDAKIIKDQDNIKKIGDPTEIAFMDLALALNLDPLQIINDFQRIHELPFDSERKLMTTVNQYNGKTYAIVKGAPDVIFTKTTNIYNQKTTLQSFKDTNIQMANQALRVLAVAYKEIKNTDNITELSFDDLETDLTLLSLMGMIDPERPEVKAAIETCKHAGIKTIMITGDHKNTAVAIAKNLNIIEDGQIALTGQELDLLSDDEFMEKLDSIRVYARVSPENKVRIVKAWKAKGLVVAMTGDGVNDAPSIKQADIGIAMGITGTEVAKGASDMVLTDDNFATIVDAVGEGRTIFANLTKSIHFLLSSNIGEIVAMTIGIVVMAAAGWGGDNHLLTAAQILWINLVTDSLLAIALGLEQKEPNVMEHSPRDSNQSIFSGGLGWRIAWQGVMFGLLTFVAYAIGYITTNDQATARTMAFLTLGISQLFHAFNVRSSEYSIFQLKQNWYVNGAFIICAILTVGVVLIPPVADIFSVANLNGLQWLIVLGFSLTPVLVIEIVKVFVRLKKKRNV